MKISIPGFDTKVIRECLQFYNSLNYRKHRNNLLLFVYGMDNKLYTISSKYHYLMGFIPELVRHMATFILDPITKNNYYKIQDNITLNSPELYLQFRYLKRPKYYIGKVITTPVKLNTTTAHPGASPNDGAGYLVSYLGWDSTFDEIVTSDQIHKLDYITCKYLLTLKVNSCIDCFNPITKTWYGGFVTRMHYLKNTMVGLDFISGYLSDGKQAYLYALNIPIYSSNIIAPHTHYGGYFTKHRSLMKACEIYNRSLPRKFVSCNTVSAVGDIIKIGKNYTSFTLGPVIIPT